MKIKNFNDWIVECEKFTRSTDQILSTRKLAENLLTKDGFSSDEKLFLYVLKESNTSLFEWENLNEGLIDKLKELGTKAVDSGKEFFNDVKDAIGKDINGIPDFFKALGTGLKNLLTMIQDFIKGVIAVMFKTPYDWTKKALGGNFNNFEDKIKEECKDNASKIKEESNGVSDLVTGAIKLLSPTVIVDKMDKALSNADTQDIKTADLTVVEESFKSAILFSIAEAVQNHTLDEIKSGIQYLNEEDHGHTKIPFISTMSGILEKLPPFKQLSQLAGLIGKQSNKILTNVSQYMQKAGAIKKSTDFIIIGSLVGLGLEYMVKSHAKHALTVMFPPLHSVLIILGGIATSICVVHVASTVIDGLKDKKDHIKAEAANIV